MSHAVDVDAVRAARERVSDRVHRTPLFGSRTLGDRIGAPVLLKCENLQKTGSFKPRGALNRLLTLESGARDRGVITISAGNHAQALAWAGGAAGVPATVVMPESAPRSKVRACHGYGAEVILHGDVFEAFQRSLELADERALTFVHPFDDERIVAGQGTAALEIAEDADDLAAVVVPVGGGGLISGIAVAMAGLDPSIRIYGVEPEGAAAMRRSLDAGEALHLDEVDTVADGLAAPMAGNLTYELVRRYVEDVVVVSDAEIVEAMELILARCKLLVEPAGAAGVAALLAGRIPLPNGPVAAVLSGGNVDLDRLPELFALAEGEGSSAG